MNLTNTERIELELVFTLENLNRLKSEVNEGTIAAKTISTNLSHLIERINWINKFNEENKQANK
jgi:hypothetical protein